MRHLNLTELAGLALVAIFAIGVTACSGSKKQQVPQDQPTQGSTAEQKSKTVILYQYRFNPNQLTIVKGTKVTFENKDPDKHNVNIPQLNISEDLENGDEFSHTFETVGEFAVSDRFSSTGMKMTIKVKETMEEAESSDNGSSSSGDESGSGGES